ncbi:uracil-DNA glycosylase [Spirochaeta africana]|uniref:Type-4 uracil-DNA glycosylase n=1 Tax=Spirochaeta africana (strain ATCC 700263 / DSM 8902 / Z-7692) TaxID=889378 RepID=H9UI22_SPIAZ|nr:uracil-DNA glycosylase [Spirochaeta africana]AFG37165.1 uracil-DNA glycosylase, family 4 [Spirochaeta africana DSM 8902]
MTEAVWELLNDLEDYMKTGFRSEHPAAPTLADVQAAVRQLQQTGSPGRPGRSAARTDNGAATPAGPAAAGQAGASAGRARHAAGSAPEQRPVGRSDLPGGNAAGPGGLLEAVATEVASCTACALHAERNRTVPGIGSPEPLVCVIGEGPGADEDRMGLPFVGPSGQYLDKWLKAIGLSRHRNVFITNVVKCRPPANRNPAAEETAACDGYLQRQLDALQPPMLLVLGQVAAHSLLNTDTPLADLRGQLHRIKGIPAVVTWHPSAVLRNQDLRSEVWRDLQYMRDELMQLRSDYRPEIR